MAVTNVVALVGAKGSGKTHALQMLAHAAPAGSAKLRAVGETRSVGITLDLVDGLDATPTFAGTMLAAISPHEVDEFQIAHPGAQIVKLRPMSSDDMRAMTKLLSRQLELPSGAITLRAQAVLERRCRGHPGVLGLLLRLADRAAKTDQVPRISASHIYRAWTELTTLPKPATQSTLCSLEVKIVEQEAKSEVELATHRSVAVSAHSTSVKPPMSAWDILNSPLEQPAALQHSVRRLLRTAPSQRSRRRYVAGLAVALSMMALGGAVTPWAIVGSAAVKLQLYAYTAMSDAWHYVTALNYPRPVLPPLTLAITPPGNRVN